MSFLQCDTLLEEPRNIGIPESVEVNLSLFGLTRDPSSLQLVLKSPGRVRWNWGQRLFRFQLFHSVCQFIHQPVRQRLEVVPSALRPFRIQMHASHVEYPFHCWTSRKSTLCPRPARLSAARPSPARKATGHPGRHCSCCPGNSPLSTSAAGRSARPPRALYPWWPQDTRARRSDDPRGMPGERRSPPGEVSLTKRETGQIMVKTLIRLQDLRKRIYVRAKAEMCRQSRESAGR